MKVAAGNASEAVTPYTFRSLYHDYARRLADIPETGDALIRFAKDLEREGENGALSDAEQSQLVKSFSSKLVAIFKSSAEFNL